MADTIGLTLAEHGAYLLSIFAYWRKRGPLTQAEMDSVCNSHCHSVCRFFVKESADGSVQWRHKRIDQELSEAEIRKTEQNRKTEAARAALAKKRRSVTDTVTDTVTIPVTIPVTNSSSPSPSPSQEREEENTRSEGQEPTIEEVIDFGNGGSAIPESYCRHFHAKHTENHGWIKNQRLIDWRKVIVRWWATDRDNPQWTVSQNHYQNPVQLGTHGFPVPRMQ